MNPIDSRQILFPTSSVSTFENPFILCCMAQLNRWSNSSKLWRVTLWKNWNALHAIPSTFKIRPPKKLDENIRPVYRLEDFDNLFHPSSQFHDKVSICQQITFGQISPIIHYLFWILYLTGPQLLNFSLDTFAAFTYVAYLENRGDRNKGDSSKSGPGRMLIRCSWILKGFRHT